MSETDDGLLTSCPAVLLEARCSQQLGAAGAHGNSNPNVQVLGKVTIAFGVFAFFGVLVILAVLLGRDEPVGYAFVVRTSVQLGSQPQLGPEARRMLALRVQCACALLAPFDSARSKLDQRCQHSYNILLCRCFSSSTSPSSPLVRPTSSCHRCQQFGCLRHHPVAKHCICNAQG